MFTDLPTPFGMLAELDKAGGTLPQRRFGLEYDDAADWLFRAGFIDCTREEVSISAKGREQLEFKKRMFPLVSH